MERSFAQKLLRWKESPLRKPLIVNGVRQVGKTYTISEFGAQHFPKMHYVNFEKDMRLAKIFTDDLTPQNLVQALGFHLNEKIDVERDFLFFDEIQACPRALTSLKYFQEEMPELAICAAGSLLGVYLGPTSFPVGKVDLLNVFPMSFIEFLQGIDDGKSLAYLNEVKRKDRTPEIIHMHLWEQLKKYFIVGGMPEIVEIFRQQQGDLVTAFAAVRERQEILLALYGADMAKHAGKVNAMHLTRVWQSVATQLAKEHDGSVARFRFKGIVPEINRYSRLAGVIDWLEAAGLIIKVPIIARAELPLAAYTKENIFKLFVMDVGLLGAMVGLSPAIILDYKYGTYKGYFAENFVAQEFVAASEKRLYSWHDGNFEIEFLRVIEDQIVPVEVKAGNIVRAKSLSTFVSKYNSNYSVVMSARPLNIDSEHGLHGYPLYMAGLFPL